MMKDVLGLNFKLITGYPTGNHNNLAMERGEIDGWAASWENLIGTRPHWITEKKVTLLAQFVLERKPQIPDVPTLLELAPPDKKDVVEFLSAVDAVRPRHGGRPRRAGRSRRRAADGVRSDHARIRRSSRRRRSGRSTSTGATISTPMSLVKKIVGASPDLIARVKKSIGQED